MTDELATALHAMADSAGPHWIDADRAIREGLRARKRRRAALGGGAAAAVAAIVAGGVVANIVVAGPGRAGPDGSAPPTVSPSVTATPSPRLSPGTVLPADPADPLTTSWQFGYLPPDMVQSGGTWEGTDPDSGMSRASTRDGTFGYVLTDSLARPDLDLSKDEPTTVDGAVQAYIVKSYDAPVVMDRPIMTDLVWERPDGYWMTLTSMMADRRPGWADEARRIAAHVVHQDRGVPFPFRIAATSVQVPVTAANLYGDGPDFSAELSYNENPGWVHLYAIRAGNKETAEGVKSDGTVNRCQDSNGLTLCVTMSGPPPAWLTALGGMEGLLHRITALGTDPAGWTRQVYQ